MPAAANDKMIAGAGFLTVAQKDFDELSNEDKAKACDNAVRSLYGVLAKGWLALGDVVARVHDAELWRYLDDPQTGKRYTSFKDWVERATCKGRATVYAAMRVVQQLKVPRHRLMNMTKENAEWLIKLQRGGHKLTDDILDLAETMPENEFMAMVQSLLQGCAKIEVTHFVKLALPQSMMELFEKAMTVAGDLNGTGKDKAAAIERIIIDFLQCPNLEMMEQGIEMTNEDAHQELVRRAGAAVHFKVGASA